MGLHALTGIPYGSVLTRRAESRPEQIALICEDEAISCIELETRATRLARVFEGEGVGPGDLVSLVLPNGIGLVSAMLATWKLGAVPNPLSPGLPGAELSAILERAHVGTAPGIDFGSAAEGMLRLCYAVSEEALDEALERLAAVLPELESENRVGRQR